MSANRPKTIVVCGIAGVGKTYLTTRAASLLPASVLWQASAIIKEARKVADPEVLRRLGADQMQQSQKLLVAGFETKCAESNSEIILLDAHSVIDTDSGLFEVGTDIMRQLRPLAFVHVEDDVTAIIQRRCQDIVRQRPVRTPDQISNYQRRSLEVCEAYGKEMERQVFRLRSGDVDSFCNIVRAAQSISCGC